MGKGALQRVSGWCDDMSSSHEVRLSALTGKTDFRKVSVSAGLRYRPRKFPESGTTHLVRLFCDMAREAVFIYRRDLFLFERLKEDIQAVKERDPAATSDLEILLTYSGLHAIQHYRTAHWFYNHGMHTTARIISQTSRFFTGIEIHPAAKIGRRFFIDHGMGVVIGETAEIGDDCLLYQGVTLGGTGKDKGKRHPTLGNNVMVGSGAKVLGPFKVGNNVKIAAGAVVLEELPDNCTAVGVPARIVRRDGQKVECPVKNLDQVHIPNPIEVEICQLRHQVKYLEKRLAQLEKTNEENRKK